MTQKEVRSLFVAADELYRLLRYVISLQSEMILAAGKTAASRNTIITLAINRIIADMMDGLSQANRAVLFKSMAKHVDFMLSARSKKKKRGRK